jgi:enoyl reductase-like protein
MKRTNLSEMTVEQLVRRFTEIALEQDKAILMDDNAKFNRLYLQMKAAEEELKSRAGDQRRALLPLYRHSNLQVRLKAAIATLAAVPEQARDELQAISASRQYPQAGDAGMTLKALDQGIFKPV